MEFIAAPVPVPLAYRVEDAFQKRMLEFEPWIGPAAVSFETKLPIPPSCGLFNSDGFFRLKSQHRSICFAPKGQEPIRNVFCIKGMEPLAPDFCSKLDEMAASRGPGGFLNLLEYFILKEDKMPGCLLFDEARAEAIIAATIQMRLSKDGEEIPRLPFPVVCVRLPDATAESAVREIAARVSPCLRPKVGLLAATGLGAYVYWYPSLPLRAEDFSTSRKLAISISESWINLAARLLRAGFLPTTAHSLGRGSCCEPQNAVVDGGFVDLSSVVPVADISSRQDVFIALHMAIGQITETILCVLGQDRSRIAPSDYVSQMVRHNVRERLARTCGRGADPRLMQFFGATKTVGAIARFLDQA